MFMKGDWEKPVVNYPVDFLFEPQISSVSSQLRR